jgi:HEAT repeat protein
MQYTKKTYQITITIIFALFILPAICSASDLNCTENLKKILAEISTKTYEPTVLPNMTYQPPVNTQDAENKLIELAKENNSNPKTCEIIENSLLEFLNTDITLEAKEVACKALSIIGTEKCIPKLAPMLLDPNTNDMARFALERIQHKSALDAIRDALIKTKGRSKIGIINSIGFRKDKNAVTLLAAEVNNPDTSITSSAIWALGQIADSNSVQILEKVLNSNASMKIQTYNALLACAENYRLQKNNEQALNIYMQLWQQNEFPFLRAAAIKGIFAIKGKESQDLILAAINDQQKDVQTAAFELVRSYPDVEFIKETEARDISAENQVKLISALADRNDKIFFPYILQSLDSSDNYVRIAALRAMITLADSSVIPKVTKIAAYSQGKEQILARKVLCRITDSNADNIILQGILTATDPNIKIEFIAAVGERNISTKEAIDIIFNAAGDNNKKVKFQAVDTLGKLINSDDLPKLAEIYIKTAAADEQKAVEKAIISAIQRLPDNRKNAQALIQIYDSQQNIQTKSKMLMLLAKTKSENALDKIRQSVKDNNIEIQKASIAAFSSWHNLEPISDLKQIIKNSDNQACKILALRGLIQLIDTDKNISPEKAVQLYMEAFSMAEQTNEKKMILSGLAKIKSALALQETAKFLDDKELNKEVQSAAIEISKNIYSENKELVEKILKQIINKSENEAIKSQAQQVLSKH